MGIANLIQRALEIERGFKGMDFSFKREGATGLCRTCEHLKFTRFNNGESRMLCGQMREEFSTPGYITAPVVECTMWEPLNAMPLWEMRQVAWRLTTAKGGKIGFKPPKDNERSIFYNEDPD